MNGSLIRGAVEIPNARRTDSTTAQLLAQAFDAVLRDTGIAPDEIDGLGVASFTLRPDRAIDMAWQLGLTLNWCMDDGNGGASGLNMLQHALAAIETGQARQIVLLAGDAFTPEAFQQLATNYNGTTRDFLRPMGIANPNSLFALATQRHMARHGLQRRDYGELVLAQRRWAQRNPNAVYRSELSMDEYLAAPPVADPLVIYDCVPVVAGANALVLCAADLVPSRAGCVRVRGIATAYNTDQQLGDGLSTGLRAIAGALFQRAGVRPEDIDGTCVYDDYPVMSLVQLEDLGLVTPQTLPSFLRERLPRGDVAINTSGGQLSAGQAGCAGGLHGVVEVVRQLSGRCSTRAWPKARLGLVSGYGMVQYRWGMCANAAILEACE